MQQQPNQLSPWQAWSLDVARQLQSQQESIASLEQQLAAICEQLKSLKRSLLIMWKICSTILTN